jgi:hypothetical protein
MMNNEGMCAESFLLRVESEVQLGVIILQSHGP